MNIFSESMFGMKKKRATIKLAVSLAKSDERCTKGAQEIALLGPKSNALKL